MTGRIKHIIVIQSLENERLTGSELYNDCIKRRIDLQGLNFTHRLFDVKNKAELLNLLKQYGQNAPLYEEGLLFHLEMHGEDQQNGLILSNGELITWNELVDLFREINIKTNNNLYVTMATCYGRYMYQGVDPYKKSPYAAFISASSEVYNDKILVSRHFDNVV